MEPIIEYFNLKRSVLKERQIQESPASTDRLTVKIGERNFQLYCIQVRLRKKPPNHQEFLNYSTIISLVLHELAHLVYFNHSDKFILLLKYLYARATQTGVFDPTQTAQIRSKYLWERALFETGGFLSRKYLLSLKEEMKIK